MSITYSGTARVAVNKAGRRLMLVAVVVLAGLVVTIVASFFPPLTEGERAEMMIEATQDLPQDR